MKKKKKNTERPAAIGSVNTHDTMIRPTTRRSIAPMPRARPTPSTEPTRMCVVDTGMPRRDASTMVSAAASPAATTPAATGGATTQAVSGEKVYTANCASCHQAMGQGLPGTFPPLAGAEIPNGDPARHINVVLNGLNGEVTVKGQKYNGAMPPWKQLSDDDLAAVITYERTSWGNSGGPVTADDIKKARK